MAACVQFAVFLVMQCRTLACGMLLPTFRVNLPTPTILMQIILHKLAQIFVSKVILDPMELTVYKNHHRK